MKQMSTRNKLRAKPAKLTLEFLAFHQANPRIYTLFAQFASQSPRRRFGSRAILERIRWETNLKTNHNTLKIPNAYSAYYSRLFEINYPRYDGMFQHNNSTANELYDLTIKTDENNQLTFSFFN